MKLFGRPSQIAIEVGDCIGEFGGDGPYIQFRFVIFGRQFGDWNDRIPLNASVERAMDFQSSKPHRLNDDLRDVSTEVFFDLTYDAFFRYDYTLQPILTPNLRDRYQLSEIGMSALSDKIGISVAEFSNERVRIVAKDLRTEEFVVDELFKSQLLDQTCQDFIDWSRSFNS